MAWKPAGGESVAEGLVVDVVVVEGADEDGEVVVAVWEGVSRGFVMRWMR